MDVRALGVVAVEQDPVSLVIVVERDPAKAIALGERLRMPFGQPVEIHNHHDQPTGKGLEIEATLEDPPSLGHAER